MVATRESSEKAMEMPSNGHKAFKQWGHGHLYIDGHSRVGEVRASTNQRVSMGAPTRTAPGLSHSAGKIPSPHAENNPMRPSVTLLVLCGLLSPGVSHPSPPGCAATIPELARLTGEPAFALTWTETSMSDGKPLVVSISERHGLLALAFTKTREGLWAESTGVICPSGADLEIVVSKEQIRLGPAANWLMRQALGQGATFRISRPAPEQLTIATTGWSGRFMPLKPACHAAATCP